MSNTQQKEGRDPSAIVKAAKPLISWYRANKPAVKRLALTPDDYKNIEKAQQRTLNNNGIRKIDEKFYYEDFELYSKP